MSTATHNSEARRVHSRALLVGKDWFPYVAGGLNRYFHGEVHALPRVGLGGTALVEHARGDEGAPLDLRGMGAPGAPVPARWTGAARAAKRVLKEGVDLVHSHFALYTFSWLRAIPTSVPLIVTFHGPWAAELAAEVAGGGTARSRWRSRMAHFIERTVYRRADRVITLSRAFADIARDSYGVPEERLRVIGGGLDLTDYFAAPTRAEARRRLGWPDDRVILFTVRRLARRMGLEGLIEAMEQLRRKHPRALLLIGGKGALADELNRAVRERSLQQHVHLLGFIPDADLPVAYAAANYTVVPTVALEGFGLVTAESLAAGTPVMGTPIGGTPEVLHGLDPGLLFRSAQPRHLVEGLEQALSGTFTAPSASACREYARRYDWEAIMPRINEVFAEAQGERCRP